MIASAIAFRNLFLHRAKTLMIGSIMCLGIAVLFVGNSLIDTAVNGLERIFVKGYTGDFMLTGPTVFPTTVFAQTAGGEDSVPHIRESAALASFLSARPDVSGLLPLLSGRTAIGIGEQALGDLPMFGVDIEAYRRFFPGNITLVSGSWPEAGKGAWLMLPESALAKVSGTGSAPVAVGSRITLSAVGEQAGTVIREVVLGAVFRFNQNNRDLADIGLSDADTMRDLLGFASLRDGPIRLSAAESAFVESFDPESLFSGETPLPSGASAEASIDAGAAAADDSPDPGDVSRQPLPAWQFILVSIKKGHGASRAMAAAEKEAARLEVDTRVQSWVEGAGTVARTAMTVRLVFDLLVSIVAVVVVIITMNALVVSIGERVAEIGTLRAIGARRAFVRSMVLQETAFLAAMAGMIGLAAGGLVLLVLSRVGIPAPNLFFEALFGGPLLLPRVSAGAAVKAFLWIASLSLLSSWYPTRIALRIKPVTAMQTD
jgi:putative ABC transport system permease protein